MRHVRVGAGKARLTEPLSLRLLARQCGVYLALLGLMLQLAMSFGHVHARDFAVLSTAHSGTVGGWHGAAKQATASAPARQADDEDQCPICFSGSLLLSSFIPDVAQPPSSFDFAEAGHALAPAFDGVLESRRAAFQSRAPPRG